MAEPALRSIEIETFKVAIENLDEAGFKNEVAKLAAGGSLELRDAIAEIAVDEFGDVGRETVLQIWNGIRLVSLSGRFDALSPKIEEAKRKLAEPKPALSYRRYPKSDHVAKSGDASFFGSATQPKAESSQKDNLAKEPQAQEEAEPVKAGLPAIVPPPPMPATWDDLLTAMNKQHAIIDNVGGKAVIASWEPSSLDPTRLMVAFQNKESFLLRYSNRYATIEITTKRGAIAQAEVPLSQWWLTHRHRRQYRGITFWPGKGKVINECLNLWRDWGCEAREGDWSLIRDHIETVLAGGNAEFADYLIHWIAWSIQNPDKQAEVALVLIGVKGAGKGTLVRCLERIFGQHSFQVSSREEVIGKFNGHLQDCILFIADEATTRRGQSGYFKALHRQIAEGGAEAMFYELRAMDLEGWHPREIPEALRNNSALQKQQNYNLPPLEQWYLTLLHSGKLPHAKPKTPYVAMTRALVENAKQRVPRLRELSDVALRNFLTDQEAMGIEIKKHRTASANGWEFPLLSECRGAWAKRYGPTEWDTNINDWGDEEEEEQPVAIK